MPFVHHQTYINTSPPLRTNWTSGGSIDSTRITGVGSLTPKVGTRLLYQTPTIDVADSYVKYNNNIASTWNQYTIEGWIAPLHPNSWQTTASARNIVIGNGAGYIRVYIVPNQPTNQWLIGCSYYPGDGTNVSIASPGLLLSQDTWYYFTVVKLDSGTRFFMLNGVQAGTTNTNIFNETVNTTTGTAFQIGNTSDNNVMPVAFDMMRISNIARYTLGETFTPPTTAFANDKNTWFLNDWETSLLPAPSPT